MVNRAIEKVNGLNFNEATEMKKLHSRNWVSVSEISCIMSDIGQLTRTTGKCPPKHQCHGFKTFNNRFGLPGQRPADHVGSIHSPSSNSMPHWQLKKSARSDVAVKAVSAKREAIVGNLGHAVVVDERRGHYAHVEYLVTLELQHNHFTITIIIIIITTRTIFILLSS